MFGTCLHGIWGSSYIPRTPGGGGVTLPFDFHMESLSTLMQTAEILHLVLSEKVELGMKGASNLTSDKPF